MLGIRFQATALQMLQEARCGGTFAASASAALTVEASDVRTAKSTSSTSLPSMNSEYVYTSDRLTWLRFPCSVNLCSSLLLLSRWAQAR